MAYIDTKTKTLTKLFEENKFLQVPEYQRKFEWDDDNFIYLISELCERNENASRFLNKVKKYDNPVLHELAQDKDFRKSQIFLGNIVLREKDIVDGQQRLTSLMVIMQALIKVSEEKGIDTFDMPFLSAIKSYVITTSGGKKYPLISSKVANQSELNRALVGLSDKKIGNFKIFKLFNKAKEKISELCTLERDFERTAFRILSIQVIVLSLDSIEDAFDVFEKLNSKSTPLAPADLIKNKILSIAHKRGEYDAYSRYFLEIYGNLDESIDLTTFIRMVSMIHKAKTADKNTDVYVKKNSLYKDVFEDSEDDEIVGMFETIKKYSSIYNEYFVSLSSKIQDEHRNLIKRFLDTKKSKILSTLTLYLTTLFESGKLIYNEYIHLIKWIENYFLRMFTLANNPAKEVDKLIPKALFEINKLEIKNEREIKNIFNKNFVPELKDEKEPYKFLLTNNFNNEKSKHLLMKLWDEMHIEIPGVTTTIKENKCHLEHLLPQKPTNWINKYDLWNKYKITGENGTPSRDDDIYKIIYSIGNHFLVKDKDNIIAGNKTLDEKLRSLRNDSIFEAASFIERIKVWDPSSIKKRTQVIYKKFKDNKILELD